MATARQYAVELIKFAWKSRRRHVILVVFCSITALFVAIKKSESRLHQDHADTPIAVNERITGYWTIFDRVVTASTLAVAIALWLDAVRGEWERRLPRRLFAYYVHEGEVIACCLGASIGTSDDVRALGQQIGKQLFKVNLNMNTTNILQRELPAVIAAHESFKPIAIILDLLDGNLLEQRNVPKGKSLLWIAPNREPERVNSSDPCCHRPGDELSDTAIKALSKNLANGTVP